jgi:predicted PurR-regulated permease PerM
MKISTFVATIVIIGAVFFLFAQMVKEGNSTYSSNINSSEWDTKYDYVNRVNDTIAPIQKSFNDIQDENNGWFTKLTAGITAIPRAIISIPVMLFSAFSIGGGFISGVFTAFGLPVYLLTVALLLLVIWGIFKLIELFGRWQV